MKKILFLLLVTISSYGQTYQNPTFGTVTTKTNTESATANKINVQETDGKINWLQPVNIPIPYVPTNYLPTATTLGGHLTGIDNKLGSIVATTAGQTTRVWFTADQTTITAGTFDLTNQTGKGTAPSHIQSITNDDNQKKYYTTDLISIAFPTASLSPAGIYAGNLSASTTPNSAQQRWTVEIYKCNNAGTPIASGIIGAPVGDLGVTVIAILDSGLLTLADGSVTNVQVSGNLASPLSMAVGERIRYHVSAEKVGTAASNITQSVYYGNSYNSYYDVPVVNTTDTTINKSLVSGTTTTDALNNLYSATDFPSTAYVQTTGNNTTAQLGNIKRPFLTIDAALDALPVSGGVIKIGIGSFNSPTPSKIKSNTSFIGSKEPAINSTVTISAPNTRPTITAPTALINGTILTGLFSALDKTNITVEKLGIDVGKTWIDTFNGGVTVGGLVIASTTTTSPIKNIKVNNVTVLGYSPTTAQHCMLFENVVNSTFTNLTTYYHVHGVAIKGLSLLIDGINSYSHNNDGLIIKSDIYAPTRDVEISNVNITSLSGYESGGIILEEGVNGSSLLERVSLNNISLKYVRYGLNNVNKVSNINISNFNLYDSNTFGINLSGGDVDKINLTGINIVKTTTEGIKISLSGSQTVNIVNANVSDATTTGFELTAVASSTINIVNSNTLNTTASYLITGNVYGSSNFGTGTLTGYIKFYNPFIKSNGRIFSTNDASFGDLASTNGTLDFNFSNSAQKGTIESYNFTTALSKPLEIKSSALLLSALAGTGTRQVVADLNGNLSATDIASTSGTYTPILTNLVNCSALTISSATYTRIGNIVTVMFSAEGSVTTASTTTSFEIDLPINRANATQIICGMSSITSQTNANVYGGYSAISAVSKAKLVAFSPASTGGSHKFYMSFQYSVLQ